jgi:hypothetical protein
VEADAALADFGFFQGGAEFVYQDRLGIERDVLFLAAEGEFQ